jgi:hypothetical protein
MAGWVRNRRQCGPRVMSAFGPKRTFKPIDAMSASGQQQTWYLLEICSLLVLLPSRTLSAIVCARHLACDRR